MKEKNLFDQKLQLQKLMPKSTRNAATDLTDTLDLCWAAVRSVFEKEAKPEHALTLLQMVMNRADVERQRAQEEWIAQMDAASKPPAGSPSRPRKKA